MPVEGSARPVSTALAVLLVVAVGAAAKLPETLLPIGSDTGMFATYARMILDGARPYVNFFDVHPPLTYYYWTFVEAIAGTDWSRSCIGSWGVLAPQPCVSLFAHALDLGLTCLAAFLVYAIARRLGQPAFVGLLAAVFVAWFTDESMISMEGSNPTKLTLVPSTLAMYAFIRALDANAGGRWWAVLAGGAGMLAGLAKQPGLITLVALFTYTFTGSLRGARQTLCLGLGTGAGAVLAAVCLYLWRIGSLAGFVDEAWLYNVQRFLIGYWQTPAGLTSPATRIDHVATESAGLLFVGALVGGLALWLGPTRPPQRVLLVWGLFSLVAIAGFREFAQVVPSLALLAAIGISRLWYAASTDGLGLGRPLAGRIALVALLGTIFVLSSGFQIIELRRAQFERGPRGTPSDPDLIATYLRTSAPAGPIFVWGNAGQIYALSGREPASRFVIAEFTNATSPRPALSRAEVIDDVRARPPAAVVLAPHSDDPDLTLSGFPAFEQLLAACYRQVSPGASVPAWKIYVQSSGQPGC